MRRPLTFFRLIVVGVHAALALPVACGSRTALTFDLDGSTGPSGGFAGSGGAGGFGGNGVDAPEGFDGGGDASPDSPIHPSDGGRKRCKAGSLSGFTPGLNPSAVSSGKCTSAQIVNLVNDCFTGKPDAGTCEALLEDPPTKTCLTGCIETDWTAASSGLTYSPTPWGAMVYLANPGRTPSLDLGACFALAAPDDPAVQSCAKVTEELVECTFQVCAANCPVPTSSDCRADPACEGPENALDHCLLVATSGACNTYDEEQMTACASVLDAGTGPVFDCINDYNIIESTDEDTGAAGPAALIQFFDIVCLGSLPDGG